MRDTEARDALAAALRQEPSIKFAIGRLGRLNDVAWEQIADRLLAALDGWTLVPVALAEAAAAAAPAMAWLATLLDKAVLSIPPETRMDWASFSQDHQRAHAASDALAAAVAALGTTR